jgi:hypothetical protein
MDDARQLCVSLLAKIHEQIEGSEHLIGLLPADSLDWAPAIPGAWPVGILLGHLLDCMAGFCAVLSAFEPQRLAGFVSLRELPVNHRCSPGEASRRIVTYVHTLTRASRCSETKTSVSRYPQSLSSMASHF